MTATGGSLETVSINGREFPVAADAEVTRGLGGWGNETESNGDGSARLIKTRKTWKLEGMTVQIDDDRGDHEFLQDLANGRTFFAVVATYASGNSYQGTGQITGDLDHASKSTTASLSLSGPGELTKQ